MLLLAGWLMACMPPDRVFHHSFCGTCKAEELQQLRMVHQAQRCSMVLPSCNTALLHMGTLNVQASCISNAPAAAVQTQAGLAW